MSVAIFPHSDFESLVAGLGGRSQPESPVLVPVVVPSMAFSDYLQQRLADRFGICMGWEFLRPQDFIHRAVGPGARSPWAQRELLWRVLPHVDANAGFLGVGNPSVRDRFVLAGLIADRFDQYGHYRPDLLRGWVKGSKAKSDEHEDWQRQLWLKLREEVGVEHPALELAAHQRDEAFRRDLTARHPKLTVLGSGMLDPLLVEVLGILSDGGAEVVLHMVLPTMEYLGDLKKRSAIPAEECDPEDVTSEGGHPLLVSLGRQAIGAFRLLGRLDDQYTHWPEAGSAREGSHTLLGRLQEDIRALREPHSGAERDSSLCVHSCFGPRREMEVLRDELLRAFVELPDLKPDEVHIVTPDLKTYAPLLSAVLRHGGIPLPVRLCEEMSALENPFIDALQALLRIAHGARFEVSEVLELVQKLPVLEALGTEDSERLQEWLRDCGFTHGVGDNGPGSAGFSIDRLIAGRWFADGHPARYPKGGFVLPVQDAMGSDGGLRDRFLDWLCELESTMREWARPACASEWARRLAGASQNLLGGDDEVSIQPMIDFLASRKCEVALDAGAVQDWVEAESAGSGRRHRIAGSMAFGQFKHLHNLPCRVLAMVGMQDAAFPSRNRIPAWDLLQRDPRIWDRNPRLDDRQQFLDALLTPTDRLILTASTKNLRTRVTEPFSSCVDELLRVVAKMGAARPVIEHRLQPFVPEYFIRQDALPRSFDAFHAAVAEKIRATHEPESARFLEGTSLPTTDAAEEITVMELAKFWKSPAAAFVKSLGIFMAGEQASDEDLNRAPFSPNSLQMWGIKQSIVEAFCSCGGNDLDFLKSRIAASRGLPPGELGENFWQSTLERIRPLAEAVAEQSGAVERLRVSGISGVLLSGDLTRAADGAAWLAYRIGKLGTANDFLRIWIPALVAGACGHELPTRVLTEDRVGSPLLLAPVPQDEARRVLGELVEGFHLGKSRPLRFAPIPSETLWVTHLKKPMEEALAAAGAKWDASNDAANPLAWRDTDPFAEPDEWMQWATTISAPLHTWRTSS